MSENAEKKYTIVWNEEKKVPVIVDIEKDKDRLNKYKYMTSDLRPVFLEEKHLLYCIMPELTKNIYFKSVWNNKQGKYSTGSDPFIREIAEKYKNKIIAVSFSGGKGSTGNNFC